ANPKYYDIIEALKQLDDFCWSVNQHKNKIRKGDRVYLWVSGKQAGIIAQGTILSAPQLMAEPPEEVKFHQQNNAPTEELRVMLHVEKRFNPPILRSDLLNDPDLQSLTILKSAQMTNNPLPPEEAAAL
ncbi:MAG: EVE domain-containing protein, partial [Pseudomonadales bacterium]